MTASLKEFTPRMAHPVRDITVKKGFLRPSSSITEVISVEVLKALVDRRKESAYLMRQARIIAASRYPTATGFQTSKLIGPEVQRGCPYHTYFLAVRYFDRLQRPLLHAEYFDRLQRPLLHDM